MYAMYLHAICFSNFILHKIDMVGFSIRITTFTTPHYINSFLLTWEKPKMRLSDTRHWTAVVRDKMKETVGRMFKKYS